MSSTFLTQKQIRILRWLVFNIWFFSLVVMVASFGLSATFSQGAELENDYIKSATLLLGLITPPLGIMLAFYSNATGVRKKITVSKEFFNITIMCSVLYHLVLNVLVVRGVVFLDLVPVMEKDLLYRNCTFIVNWMGLLSVLLGPALWLFSHNQDNNSQATINNSQH